MARYQRPAVLALPAGLGNGLDWGWEGSESCRTEEIFNNFHGMRHKKFCADCKMCFSLARDNVEAGLGGFTRMGNRHCSYIVKQMTQLSKSGVLRAHRSAENPKKTNQPDELLPSAEKATFSGKNSRSVSAIYRPQYDETEP